MKLALVELNPFHISFYRIFIGMLFMNLFVTKIDKLSKKDHLNISFVGFLWMSLPFYLFAASEETISSSLAGLINGTTPVFISIIGVFFFSQKIKNAQKFYLGLGFIGIYLLTFGFNKLNLDLEIGTFLALIASISYGFAANIIQPLIEKLGALNVLKIALRYASLFSFILFIFNTEFVIPTIGESLFPMLLLGIGSSGIAFLSFYKLIGDVGSIIGSITIYLVPIFSIFFGYIFLNEETTFIQIVGIVTIIFSAYMFSNKDS
jgi:drug/metabolite transporter (DMT)-like permease|tara:strand:+ start:4101 stop:4889 length:789 start_codon:yes stop_codon:yes gene_type:complete